MQTFSTASARLAADAIGSMTRKTRVVELRERMLATSESAAVARVTDVGRRFAGVQSRLHPFGKSKIKI
ncbi:hypothetical protein [Novipirellula rosea]|uniref:hypothetical protein n=1 Tax=Novipirellula rosea TaxID=1031540 RepID=UPI0031EF3797